MRDPESSRNSSEDGTTLAEVLVVLSLIAIVAAPLYIALLSSFRIESGQTQRLDSEIAMSTVVDRFESDVRLGLPMTDRLAGSADEGLALLIERPDGSQQQVIWSITSEELRRRSSTVITGAEISDVVLLDGVGDDEVTFRYWDVNGREIAPVDIERIDQCSVRVTLELSLSRDPAISGRSIDVAHRPTSRTGSAC